MSSTEKKSPLPQRFLAGVFLGVMPIVALADPALTEEAPLAHEEYGSVGLAADLLTPFESPEGTMTFGLWYSQAERLVVTAGVEQANLFGTKENAALDLSWGEFDRSFALQLRNDTLLGGKVTRLIQISSFLHRPNEEQTGSYEIAGDSVSINFGREIAPRTWGYVGLGFDQAHLGSGGEVAAPLQTYFDTVGGRSTLVPLLLDLSRDTLEGAYFPVSGYRAALNTELGVAGDAKYLRSTVNLKGYHRLAENWVLGYRAMLGYGAGASGDEFPVLRNYFVGGPSSVRGYADGSIGGTRYTLTDGREGTVGGDRALVGSFEVSYDPPKLEKLRVSGFVDYGSAYAPGEAFSLDTLRGSVGVAVSWALPVGMISASIASPFKDQSTDQKQQFQFTLTSRF